MLRLFPLLLILSALFLCLKAPNFSENGERRSRTPQKFRFGLRRLAHDEIRHPE